MGAVHRAVEAGPPLDVIFTVALIVVLAGREIAVAAGPARRLTASVLAAGAVPLLLAFALVVVARLIVLLGVYW